MNTTFLLLLVSSSAIYVNGANILGIFASTSMSHNIIHMAGVDALIQKGHNVTVVTILPLKQKNPKYHHVYIPPPLEVQRNLEEAMEHISNAKGMDNIKTLINMVMGMINVQYDMMFTEQFQNVIHGDTKFDLLLLGYCMNDFNLAVAHQMKVPVVVSWVNMPMPPVNSLIGNPNAISYVPHSMVSSGQPMGFVDRFKSFLIHAFMYGVDKYGHYKFAQYYE